MVQLGGILYSLSLILVMLNNTQNMRDHGHQKIRFDIEMRVFLCVGSLARSIRYFACCVEETRYEGRGTRNTIVYTVTGRYLVLAKLNVSNAKQHAKHGFNGSSKDMG